jgi:hypothetical protein
MHSIPPLIFLFMLLFPLAMAGICIAAGIHARRQAAMIERVPTSRIRMARPGYVELEGKVEAIDGYTVTSPLTCAPCCWYHARIEQWVKPTRKSTGSWSALRDEMSSAPFMLRDASGICAVHPEHAQVTPTDRSLWYGASEEPEDRSPPRIGPTESATGWIEISGGTNFKFRYSEKRIYDGDPVFVLGVFSRVSPESQAEADDEEALSEEDALYARAAQLTPNRIVHGSRKQPLIISTMKQETHVAMMSKGGLAAFAIALVPLAIAAYLVWIRFLK